MSAQKNMNMTYGLHAVLALLSEQPEQVSELYIQKDRRDAKIAAILTLAKAAAHIHVRYEARATLEQMCDGANHQGVLALREKKIQIFGEEDLPDFLEKIKEKNNGTPFILILDGVQDPHNLGACFRSAEAAGVHAVIAPKDKSVGLTGTVLKVASGAAEKLPFFQVTNLARVLDILKEAGVWLFGCDEHATATIYESDLRGPIALVLGAEGAGLRRLTRERCDHLVKIPMQGAVESLNVSVATGVCLFEALRQRLRK